MNRIRASVRKRLAGSKTVAGPGISFSAAAPFLPEDPVIIEAGASTGMDLPDLREQWPRGTVHAFEPEPTAFAELAMRAKGLPNVAVWNIALGSEDGAAEMHVSSGEYGTTASSLLAPAITREAYPEMTFSTVSVEQRTLNSWASEHQVGTVDLLALDMQGYEFAALAASTEMLRRASVVISEAFLVEMYDGSPTVERFQALLTAEGFVILETRIYYGRVFEVLAVRRDVLEHAIRSGRLPTHGSFANA
jgi:FkbM family methyltransferase